jgi:hypothetical protein
MKPYTITITINGKKSSYIREYESLQQALIHQARIPRGDKAVITGMEIRETTVRDWYLFGETKADLKHGHKTIRDLVISLEIDNEDRLILFFDDDRKESRAITGKWYQDHMLKHFDTKVTAYITQKRQDGHKDILLLVSYKY